MINIDRHLYKYIDYDEIISKINELCIKFNYSGCINIYMVNSLNEMECKVEDSIPNWVIATNKGDTVYILNYLKWINKNIATISEIIIHEVVHVLINNINYKCPLWLNEGIALFYAGQTKNRVDDNENLLNPYNISYEDGLYDQASRIISILFNKYNEEIIINKIKFTHDFEHDKLLGIEAINKDLLKSI